MEKTSHAASVLLQTTKYGSRKDKARQDQYRYDNTTQHNCQRLTLWQAIREIYLIELETFLAMYTRQMNKYAKHRK